MADIDVNVQQATEAGVTPTRKNDLVATTNTYHVRNDGRVLLHFLKTGAGACTVTLQTAKTVDGHAVADQTVVVAATTGDVMIGPFPPDVYNDGEGDLCFTVSEVTGLSVAIVRV